MKGAESYAFLLIVWFYLKTEPNQQLLLLFQYFLIYCFFCGAASAETLRELSRHCTKNSERPEASRTRTRAPGNAEPDNPIVSPTPFPARCVT